MSAHPPDARRPAAHVALALLALAVALLLAPAPFVRADDATYTNPLPIQIPDDGLVESCADPTIMRGQQPGDAFWYMYCTTDPLNGADRNASGELNFHLIPTLRSSDLVHWTYVGDALSQRPTWVADDAGLWAPDITFFDGIYHLYFTTPNTDLPGGGSAIGVLTSSSPTGPWTDSGKPVVEPHAPPCCRTDRRWVFDPDVITVGGQSYIYYGSYFGGIAVRKLSADGLTSDPASQVEITIANRYEGAHVVPHGGYYYLFVSATDCCRGPLTGYSIFAGRSRNPLGPFVDAQGVSLLAGRVGGTPVISMNGNRWVGPGHNVVFTDAAGQDWTVYHAIDRTDPYFAGATGFTRRPVLLDRLDWIDGWPTVRGGLWASDTPQPAPAASSDTGRDDEGEDGTARDPRGGRLPTFSDEFAGSVLDPAWSWVRQPISSTYGLERGAFRFQTQAADLFEDSNNASVLVRQAPTSDYVVETKVSLDLPAEGCCHNYVQAGLVIYGDDDNFIKLAHVSIWETRQTEFAKEQGPVPTGYPRYGNTVVGPPGADTWLRIAKRTVGAEEHYTAYTSNDGNTWVRGGTWTHTLGANARVGLVAMGGTGYTATFHYLTTYQLKNSDTSPYPTP